jgi:DNA-binding MarR family transcriptional regulator
MLEQRWSGKLGTAERGARTSGGTVESRHDGEARREAAMPGQGGRRAMTDDGERGTPGAGAAEQDGVPEQGAWGEPAPGSSAERQRLEAEFLLAVRRNGSIIQLLGQVSAERIGINVTDLNCLNIVALTGPMTAGELARQTGLTTASITGVLDRLEEGGFVRRERDPKDRRRVIVNLNPGPGLREIGPTFGPLVKAWRAAAASYSDQDLRLLLDFQRRFEDIVRGQLARLRGDQESGTRG